MYINILNKYFLWTCIFNVYCYLDIHKAYYSQQAHICICIIQIIIFHIFRGGGVFFFTFSSNNKNFSQVKCPTFCWKNFLYSLISFQRFFLFICCYWWFFLRVDFKYFHFSLIASFSRSWIDVSFCYTCIVWPNFNFCKKNCLHQRQHIFQDKKKDKFLRKKPA